jgi:hypothetical protein
MDTTSMCPLRSDIYAPWNVCHKPIPIAKSLTARHLLHRLKTNGESLANVRYRRRVWAGS